MALDNLSEQRIQETYQKLVQTENGEFATGDGTAISIVTSNETGSFALNSTISGAFAITSHSLQDRIETLEIDGTVPLNTVSSSAQLASEISGSFLSVSASIQTRITTIESELENTLLSGSAQIASNVSGSIRSLSSSIATRFDGLTSNYTELTNIPSNIVSGSTQIKSEISGAFTSTSHSLQSRFSSFLKNTTDTLTGDLTVTGKITAEEFHTEFVTSSVILASGSTRFGNTSDDIHEFTGSIFLSGSNIQLNGLDLLPFTSTGISGSFNNISESIATRFDGLTSDYTKLTNVPVGIVSGSTQLATEISGAFTSTSHSLQNRLTVTELELSNTLISGSAQIDTEISGAFVAPSASFSTRVAGLESNAVFTSTMISGSFVAPSESFSTRVTGLEGNAVFTSTMISGSFVAPSASFSTRVTSLEDTSSNRIFNNVTASGNISASGNIKTSNINIGTPTANQWQNNLQGSYFNNFDANSDVSEILRFMAGIISHSIDTSSPTANTRTYGLDTNENSLGDATSIIGNVPQNFIGANKLTLNYLNTKGFAEIGNHPFNGLSVYHDNFSTYKIDFDSDAAGSSTIQSAADTELFGLGPLNGASANTFKVKIIASQSFSDVSSITSPNATSNKFTSESLQDLSISDFGTSNGLTLTKIQSANPAVIPAAFQDGKFANVGTLRRKYHESLTSATSVSASGYYRFHDIKVGIATGSGEYQFINGDTINKFWAPIDQINTDIGSNSLADIGTTHRALTATSRSLSGAPYLVDATYELSTKITGLFNPLYNASTTLVDMVAESVGVGTVALSGDVISTAGKTIQTADKIYSADGSTVRSTDTVPFYDDIAIITASVTFDSGTDHNMDNDGTGVDDSTFTVKTKVRNRFNSQITLDTREIKYHDPGTFGKSDASGSLAVYGQEQGFDSNELEDSDETFTGEDQRIILADNVQSFTGELFKTDTFQTNDASASLAIIGQYDLQVKPGFLVNPLGSYGYWFTSDSLPASSTGYRFYIRKFATNAQFKNTIQLSLAKLSGNVELVNWTSTANDSIACAILFESSGNGSGNSTALSTARIYDPTVSTQTVVEENVPADNIKNPFTTAIDIYGTPGSSKTGANIYTFAMNNANGMILDANDDQFYVIVRYKGDPDPITSINVGAS